MAPWVDGYQITGTASTMSKLRKAYRPDIIPPNPALAVNNAEDEEPMRFTRIVRDHHDNDDAAMWRAHFPDHPM